MAEKGHERPIPYVRQWSASHPIASEIATGKISDWDGISGDVRYAFNCCHADRE